MKNKMINAGICDAREVTEESLAGFDSVQVNAGILITSPRAKELMNRYPVRLNTAMVLISSFNHPWNPLSTGQNRRTVCPSIRTPC